MKNLLLIIIVFFMVSCNKEKPQDKLPVSEKLTPFAFSFMDTNSVDLLNPNNVAAYNINNMLLYYIKNGVKEMVYNGNLDNPRNISLSCGNLSTLIPSNITCVLGIELYDSTILQIGSNITDTICLENDGRIIRYNGEIVWDLAAESGKIPVAFITK